jgi:hypothetical protein
LRTLRKVMPPSVCWVTIVPLERRLPGPHPYLEVPAL